MREYNNIGAMRIVQYDPQTIPYTNDFETDITGWRQNATLKAPQWEWGIPNDTTFDTALSGQKAWVTNLDGEMIHHARSHLYTPVFDFTNAIHPVLEFKVRNVQGNMTNLSYSLNGEDWYLLDTCNQHHRRWYYWKDYLGQWARDTTDGVFNAYIYEDYSPVLIREDSYTGHNHKDPYTRLLDLSCFAGESQIQFRFNTALGTDNGSVLHEAGVMLDDFSIKERFWDLEVDYVDTVQISSNFTDLRFELLCYNNSNNYSVDTKVEFFLSTDTILDGGDLLLGVDTLLGVDPYFYSFLNKSYSNPSNITAYNYLIYRLDTDQQIQEIDESNNIGFWPLEDQKVDQFPYYENFEELGSVEPWKTYVENRYGDHQKNRWRIRNTDIIGLDSRREAGRLSTDRVWDGIAADLPYFYIETPEFDFSAVDSMDIGFLFEIHGGATGGANVEYSLDGGNSWDVFIDTTVTGLSINWQPFSNSIVLLNNEPGWTVFNQIYAQTDISIFRGQPSVLFRYKFRATGGISNGHDGFHLDSFTINAITVDYMALDSMTEITLNGSNTYVDLDYEILNFGDYDGRDFETHFYLSSDSIFDAGDLLIHTVADSKIAAGTIETKTTQLNHQWPITTDNYYIFYLVDADSVMNETDETNNLGSFKVNFAYPNYLAVDQFTNLNVQESANSFFLNYTYENTAIVDGLAHQVDFYWSTDSIWQATDSLLLTTSEPLLQAQGNAQRLVTINYPKPITQHNYYLFYQVNTDSSWYETNYSDNMGSFALTFDRLTTIENLAEQGLSIWVAQNQAILDFEEDPTGEDFRLRLIDVQGRELRVYEEESSGQERYQFDLPAALPLGVYYLHLERAGKTLVTKIVIGA